MNVSESLPKARERTYNGILARVPGHLIAWGSQQLPPADVEQQAQPEREVVVAVPHIGDVRIRYCLNSYRHGRSRHWGWLAVHAAVLK